jgi:hypothetical protein
VDARTNNSIARSAALSEIVAGFTTWLPKKLLHGRTVILSALASKETKVTQQRNEILREYFNIGATR